jgi:hypothetical protein
VWRIHGHRAHVQQKPVKIPALAGDWRNGTDVSGDCNFDIIVILFPAIVTLWFDFLFHGILRLEAGFPGFVPTKTAH